MSGRSGRSGRGRSGRSPSGASGSGRGGRRGGRSSSQASDARSVTEAEPPTFTPSVKFLFPASAFYDLNALVNPQNARVFFGQSRTTATAVMKRAKDSTGRTFSDAGYTFQLWNYNGTGVVTWSRYGCLPMSMTDGELSAELQSSCRAEPEFDAGSTWPALNVLKDSWMSLVGAEEGQEQTVEMVGFLKAECVSDQLDFLKQMLPDVWWVTAEAMTSTTGSSQRSPWHHFASLVTAVTELWLCCSGEGSDEALGKLKAYVHNPGDAPEVLIMYLLDEKGKLVSRSRDRPESQGGKAHHLFGWKVVPAMAASVVEVDDAQGTRNLVVMGPSSVTQIVTAALENCVIELEAPMLHAVPTERSAKKQLQTGKRVAEREAPASPRVMDLTQIEAACEPQLAAKNLTGPDQPQRQPVQSTPAQGPAQGQLPRALGEQQLASAAPGGPTQAEASQSHGATAQSPPAQRAAEPCEAAQPVQPAASSKEQTLALMDAYHQLQNHMAGVEDLSNRELKRCKKVLTDADMMTPQFAALKRKQKNPVAAISLEGAVEAETLQHPDANMATARLLRDVKRGHAQFAGEHGRGGAETSAHGRKKRKKNK